MSRVEMGYVDFVSRSSKEGRLTFFRTSAGRGRALMTLPDERERIWQPRSFVHACDEIADCQQVIRAFIWNELAMRMVMVTGRSWTVESMSGDIMAGGIILDVFDTPHEIAHGMTVALATVAHPSVEPDHESNVKTILPAGVIGKGFRILGQFTGNTADRGNPSVSR